MKPIFIYLFFLSFLDANFTTLSTSQVKQEIKKKTILIDIRREEEYKKHGTIKGSYKLTFFDKKGQYNIEQWLNKFSQIIKNKNKKFILICAHANRTKIVGKMLSNHLNYKNVYELDGGINYGWIDKGLSVTKENK